MWYANKRRLNLGQPVLFLVIIFFLFFPHHCLLPSFPPPSLPSFLLKVIPGRKNEFEFRKCGCFLNKELTTLNTNAFFFGKVLYTSKVQLSWVISPLSLVKIP